MVSPRNGALARVLDTARALHEAGRHEDAISLVYLCCLASYLSLEEFAELTGEPGMEPIREFLNAAIALFGGYAPGSSEREDRPDSPTKDDWEGASPAVNANEVPSTNVAVGPTLGGEGKNDKSSHGASILPARPSALCPCDPREEVAISWRRVMAAIATAAQGCAEPDPAAFNELLRWSPLQPPP